MATSLAKQYIPVGCLELDIETDDELWSLLEPGQWRTFRHADDAPADAHNASHLSPELQKALMHSLPLEPFLRLLHKRWIRVEFSISKDDEFIGIYRIFVLPGDVERRTIPRGDPKLSKDLQVLLTKLDYSNSLWNGYLGEDKVSSPRVSGQGPNREQEKDDEDASLLQMFNTIPSPSPQLDLINDDNYQKAAESLMASRVAGLSTTLHGYQSRSAALMLQREVVPGCVVDPRLQHVLDQNGATWYYDGVAGTVLREPRYYDGIAGGILAEELGTGKTLICLALILATKYFPVETPDLFRGQSHGTRPEVGSLADMAAAALNHASVPWGLYLQSPEADHYEYKNCVQVIERNPGWYLQSRHETRRQSRNPQTETPPSKVYLSHCSLVIVPTNLCEQWKQEIEKHTTGLKVLVLTGKKDVPELQEIRKCDILLFALARFEKLKQLRVPAASGWRLDSPLAHLHFKRVIVDEGHKIGNSRIGKKSDMLLVLDCLQISARWIVTGTPSTGLFGVDDSAPTTPTSETSELDKFSPQTTPAKKLAESSGDQERKDLDRIGAMASLYLKARPWANLQNETGDTTADWAVYVMQPKHSTRSSGRRDCLRPTLDSLIIRHQRSEIGDLLPLVNEKVVVLEGSFQDKLCLNLFSMMIIFNAVQSQRTDQDYFFHQSQRSALMQLVSNIRQSSFFGGYFYSVSEIFKAIETAQKFLEERKVAVKDEDEQLLREAIAFGHMAVKNHLKELADLFHEIPIYVKDFPGGSKFSQAWSLDGREGVMTCIDAPMILKLQQFLRPCIDAPHSLLVMFNDGRFMDKGKAERQKALSQNLTPPLSAQNSSTPGTRKAPPTLAGNTKLGKDNTPVRHRAGSLGTPGRMENIPAPSEVPETEIAGPLAKAQITATASAKLSYLIDSIVQHQSDEQIIVFYENDNVAFYLAEHLEILQIHHLIYAKGISAERRAQYVNTFNHNPKYRVLLMDISQAAFGLNLQSASRIYFINPVLNPQIEAQAIGRARRISQNKQVSVETLVLRGSLEEVIMERRQKMTQAEHRKCKSILDDKPIYEWILNAKILPLPTDSGDGLAQMRPLKTPQFLFGRGFGRVERGDEGLVVDTPNPAVNGMNGVPSVANGIKRDHATGPGVLLNGNPSPPKAKRPRVAVRFVTPETDEV